MRMNVRIAIRGLTIALFVAGLVLPTGALAGNGGTAPPQPAADGPVDPNFALSARHTVFLGKTLHVAGTDKNAAGQMVTLETRQDSDPWESVATVAVAGDGSFDTSWRPDGSGQFQLRGVLAGASSADSAPSSSAPRTVVVYKPAIATWYGPGFYGKKTACGRRLSRTTLGVAHKRLPCGTQVQISYRGHTIVVPVIDRGPFAHHASWDLTGAAAKQLGMKVTSRVGAAPLDLSLQPPAL
jgi:rare lipoprotein A